MWFQWDYHPTECSRSKEASVAMVYRKGERERGDDQELIVGLSEPSLYAERNGKPLRSFQQRKDTIWIMYYQKASLMAR